jgi:hypothetical protein
MFAKYCNSYYNYGTVKSGRLCITLKGVIPRKGGYIMENRKKLMKLMLIMIMSSPIFTMQAKQCVGQNCPYSNIDCDQCCKAGRFVSDECVRACNCAKRNDSAWAESKDFPH